jgi:hypothetical protein
MVNDEGEEQEQMNKEQGRGTDEQGTRNKEREQMNKEQGTRNR